MRPLIFCKCVVDFSEFRSSYGNLLTFLNTVSFSVAARFRLSSREAEPILVWEMRVGAVIFLKNKNASGMEPMTTTRRASALLESQKEGAVGERGLRTC
jgi:phage baseplate assembly protein W